MYSHTIKRAARAAGNRQHNGKGVTMNSDTIIYQIQALGLHGIWDSCNVDSDPYATDFNTLADAEAEVENLVNIQGRDRATLRIVEVR